jgi:hypothetical protein
MRGRSRLKRVAQGIALGAAAGVTGIIVFELTDQRILGWLATGILLGIVSEFPHPAKGRWLWWGVLGGGVIVASLLVGWLVRYPILVAWPLLGMVFGSLSAQSGVVWRITGGTIGLFAGLLGIGILPLFTIIILPSLGLPTTFDYDMDVLGLVTTGIFIGGTIAWLKGGLGKTAKMRKRRITSRGKKR